MADIYTYIYTISISNSPPGTYFIPAGMYTHVCTLGDDRPVVPRFQVVVGIHPCCVAASPSACMFAIVNRAGPN